MHHPPPETVGATFPGACRGGHRGGRDPESQAGGEPRPRGGQAGPHLTRSRPPRLGEAETGGRGHHPEPGLDGGAGLVWRGDRHTRHPNKPSKPQTIQEPLPRAELGRVPALEKGFLLCPLLTHRPPGLSYRRGDAGASEESGPEGAAVLSCLASPNVTPARPLRGPSRLRGGARASGATVEGEVCAHACL